MSVNDAVARPDADESTATRPNESTEPGVTQSADTEPSGSAGSSAPASRTEDPGEPRLSPDQVFHLLQNERRRAVLRYLRDAETDRVRMRDAAEHIAAAEHDTSVEALSSKQRQRVYVPLYQNHLPKLDAEGVVDYDQNRGVVERRPAAEQLETHLWSAETDASTDGHAAGSADGPAGANTEAAHRSRLHLAVAGLAAALFAGATFDVSVLGALPDVAVSALVVCLLVTVAVTQHFASDA